MNRSPLDTPPSGIERHHRRGLRTAFRAGPYCRSSADSTVVMYPIFEIDGSTTAGETDAVEPPATRGLVAVRRH